MKKGIISTFILSLISITLLYGNNGDTNNCYQKNDNILGLGFNYYGYLRAAPNLNVYFDYGLHEYFSLGVSMGYVSYEEGYYFLPEGYKYKYSNLSLGVKGSFHYASILNEQLDTELNTSKWDLYFSLLMGMQYQIVDEPEIDREPETVDNTENGDKKNYENYADPMFVTLWGAKYYFSDQWAGFAEAGFGARIEYSGYLKLGISYTFKNNLVKNLEEEAADDELE